MLTRMIARRSTAVALVLTAGLIPALSQADNRKGNQDGRGEHKHHHRDESFNVQVGERPYYLISKLAPGPLKTELEACADGPFYTTDFSIGHRGGGTLQIPEHTKESHEAGARMGAGVLECDVAFTSDGELVCRHDQCDLHTTTNILTTPLAEKCTKPFTSAEFDASGTRTKAASALCCTSDLTLAEFKSLKGKMDASNASAKTAAEYQGGTARWRTDLFSTGATLLTHKESIELIRGLGAKYTPELKSPNRNAKLQAEDVFGSLDAYAQKMIDEYKAAYIAPENVWPQSFDINAVLYWVEKEPAYGKQAVYLDDANVLADVPSAADLQDYAKKGIRIVAPPIWELLTVENGKIVPSQYAKDAKAAGLGIIAWSLERSGRVVEEILPTKGTSSPEFYYQSVLDGLQNDGDILTTVDVLAKDVGVLGIFSDWSATVSYYASCMHLK